MISSLMSHLAGDSYSVFFFDYLSFFSSFVLLGIVSSPLSCFILLAFWVYDAYDVIVSPLVSSI